MESVTKSKILLIGSGGIGCELLKNLALSGFTSVDVIDLDTIDVSNLNRQFLFRSHHVGKSKCEVACEAARKMAIVGEENVQYIPHHGNVKDKSRFGIKFVQNFNVVLNALDNVDARRHVNRLCLATGVPLVEAGTTGYLGQVTVIHKDSGTECYECQPKPTQKVYPICTIRSTPSMPVHTIVWAKELYKLMFGSKPENSMLFEDDNINDTAENEDETNDTTQASENGETKTGERSVYMDIILSQKPSKADSIPLKEIRKYAHDVIVALYYTEIEKQLGMDRYKTATKTPKSLSTQVIQETILNSDEIISIASPTRRSGFKTTDIWSTEESLAEFTACLEDVYSKSIPTYDDFDKDDSLSMRFVTAASNLRSFVFQIDPQQSLYSAKGIAGNIIPAIATTNAIVAGLQILNVFSILQLQLLQKETNSENYNVRERCKYVYCLREKTRKGYYLQPTNLPSHNPDCFVCRGAKVDVTLSCTEWKLQDFIEKIIKKRLGFVEPTILIGDDGGDIIHEEGEGADSDAYAVNLKKSLTKLPAGGIKGSNGDMVRIEDFSQNLEVDLCVWHKEEWDEESDGFLIGGDAAAFLKDSKKENDASIENEKNKVNDTQTNQDDDDDIIIMEDEPIPESGDSKDNKRQRSEIEDDANEITKKRKVGEQNSEGDAICID